MRLLILILVVAALIGVYFLIGGEEDSLDENLNEITQAADKSVEICPLSKENITKISFENQKFSATVVKQTDGGFILEEEPEFPLNQTRAQILFGNIVGKADGLVAEGADLTVYGLEEPTVRIVATDKDGNEYRLNVGNKIGTVSKNGYYACIDGQNTVYQIPTSLYAYFNLDKAAWITQETVPQIDTATMVAVEIESEEFGNLALFHTGAVGDGDGNPSSGNWRMEKPYSNVLGVAEAPITELLPNYATFSFGSPVDYKRENFAQYGLAEPITKLTLTYEESSDLTTDLLKKKVVLNIGNQLENGDYYVNLAGSDLVYTMTEPNVKGLVDIDANELVEKRYALIFIYTVSELEVELGDTKHLYEISYEEIVNENSESITREYSFVVDGVPLSEGSTSFNTFYTYFVNQEASFVLPEDMQPETEPILTVRYKRTNSSYQDLFMEYFPYDDSFYAVRINGVMMYAVDKRDVDTLMNGVNEYVFE